MRKVEYLGEKYPVYGSCASLGEFYFILWNEDNEEFFTVNIDECTAV